MGVFRTEGRSECVDVSECQSVSFALQLAGYGQAGFLAEEVLGIVDISFFVSWRIVHVQSGYTEHFACTFAVTSGDDWSVNIYEVLILEELVDCVCYQGTYSEYSGEHVGSRSQMCDFTQEFHGVTLRLQRVVRSGGCFHIDFSRLDFERLLGIWSQFHYTLNFQCSCHISLGDFFEVSQELFFINNLYGLEEGSVIQFNEAELVGCTVVTYPTLDYDFLSAVFCGISVEFSQQNFFHITFLFVLSLSCSLRVRLTAPLHFSIHPKPC